MHERQETRVWFLCWKDNLEEELTTHSSTLAWRIPWKESSGLQSIGLQRVGHDWARSLLSSRSWSVHGIFNRPETEADSIMSEREILHPLAPKSPSPNPLCFLIQIMNFCLWTVQHSQTTCLTFSLHTVNNRSQPCIPLLLYQTDIPWFSKEYSFFSKSTQSLKCKLLNLNAGTMAHDFQIWHPNSHADLSKWYHISQRLDLGLLTLKWEAGLKINNLLG